MRSMIVRHKWFFFLISIAFVGSSQGQEPRAPAPPPSIPAREPPNGAERELPGIPYLLSLRATEEPQDDELRKLLKSRCNEAAAELTVRHIFAPYDDIHDAATRVVEAWLELYDKPSDKVVLLTAFVKSNSVLGAYVPSETC